MPDDLMPNDQNSTPRIEEPPVDPLHDTQPRPPQEMQQPMQQQPRSSAHPLLLATVFFGTICLCVMLVGLAGFAGYRDGLATNDARITQTLATGIAEQYEAGITDLAQGYPELAEARFAWIVETIQAPPQYARDSRVQLALARTIAAYTPTPLATAPPAATATATPSPSPAVSATPTPPPPPTEPAATNTLSPTDPAHLYNQADISMRVFRYEDAIEWLDLLRSLAPDYRAAEVQAMLMEALTEQGKAYLRGWNEDGEDKLMRGVLLIYRADDIGTVEPSTLLGEAYFVENYVNARNYVNGRQYALALPVLTELCNINCGWGYRGITVRDLLDRANAGS
ncbi:MAG: hypothetical protein JW966_01560 [Anaerolineae bacterium]|nr:hypothetical protein [Anaerolineae bacterium]